MLNLKMRWCASSLVYKRNKGDDFISSLCEVVCTLANDFKFCESVNHRYDDFTFALCEVACDIKFEFCCEVCKLVCEFDE